MRILQIVHQYLPEQVGGTELYTHWLACGLVQKGHTVHIFRRLSATGQGLDSYTNEEGVTVWSAWVGEFAAMPRFTATFKEPSLESAFINVVQQVKPDLVHIEHLMGLPVDLVRYLCTQNIPYLVTLWDFWWVCANAQLITNYNSEICEGPRAYVNCARCVLARSDENWLRLALPGLPLPLAWRNRLLRQVLQKAEKIIVPSRFVKDWYAQHGMETSKMIVIPPGLDYPEKQAGSASQAQRAFRIAYIGGLTYQKGVHVLLEAFRGLPERTAELLVAGDLEFDPDYVQQLQSMATPAVTFLGKLSRESIWSLLAQVDVVVVTSIWYETFCFVVSEAFAYGVPVIASDLGVLAERVQNGVDGFLTPPGDAVALRNVLLQCQENPQVLTRLRSGIAPVKTFAQHINEIEALYQRIYTGKQ